MDDLLAARLQMGVSLGFHIVFACIGMTMPWLMFAAQRRYLRTRDADYRALARAWAKGVAVFFAVGAVSGTVLSLELGLLWPRFMAHAGPIIGLPFSWEGTAFFLEAIAIGLFLYGWERLPERVHLASGAAVGVCGVASGILVVSANAWMNSPSGFRWVNGQALDVDPVAAMFNAAWASQAVHMTLAAFVSTAFAVGGVHALCLLRGSRAALHHKGLRIALGFGAVCALLQPVSGDLSAKDVARRQPTKLAAMEALYHTERGAPLLLGGLPDDDGERVRYALRIPYALSFLAAEQARSGAPLPRLSLARRLHLLAIATGAVALFCAWRAELPWLSAAVASPIGRASFALATLLTPVVARSFARGWPWAVRLATGAQVTCVLLGLFAVEPPVLLRHREGVLTIGAAAAPSATLRTLLVALVVGLVLIVPALLYLLRVYKPMGAAPRA